MHEIEGHYFERNFIKDSLNWTESAISRKIHIDLDPSTDNFLPQKSTDCG